MAHLDINFYGYLFLDVLGLIATIVATNYYRKFGSKDYLILAYFFLSVVFLNSLFLTFWLYLTPWLEWAFDDPIKYITYVQPQVLIVRFATFVGIWLLLLQAIRMQPWESYSLITRIFAFFILLESGLYIIQDVVEYINSIIMQNVFPPAESWFYKLTILHWIFPRTETSAVALNLIYALVFGFIGYLYFIKLREHSHSIIVRSIITWIVLTISLSISWFIPIIVSQIPTLARNPGAAAFMYEVSFYFTFIGMALITALIVLYPEALLITEYQINKADKLYKLIEVDDHGILPIFGLQRVKEYLTSLEMDFASDTQEKHQKILMEATKDG